MLRYLGNDDLALMPRLRASMLRDRAAQFKTRLGWEVSVDETGAERDQYDEQSPLYVIWERRDGTHGGSMRFLPTSGRTMLNEHFAHLLPSGPLADAAIWECTRFCLCTEADHQVAAALMLGGAEVGSGYRLTHAVGVFDARMIRVYRALGWPPEIIGEAGSGRDFVGAGLWAFSEATRRRIAFRAGISPEVSRHWFRMSRSHAVSAGPVAKAA
jgi:acyl homoserine lactone synthase